MSLLYIERLLTVMCIGVIPYIALVAPLRSSPPVREQVLEFYSYVHKTAQLEKDCVVMSLFYIERLLAESAGELRICRTNWRSILLSGMILSSKVWDDLSMWSSDFARVRPQ